MSQVQARLIPDLSHYVTDEGSIHRVHLMIEGMRCASCAWQIENKLASNQDVKARINFSTRRLSLQWLGAKNRLDDLLSQIDGLGFKFMPFDIAQLNNDDLREQKFLLQCMAVAGFASGNIMLLSFALWFGDRASMGSATQDLLHWLSALVGLPAIIYAGQPFFRSALAALRQGRANMDVPISLAVILASGMSLLETIGHGTYVYFDSAIMLVFLLLVGRYLDRKARGAARAAAQDMLQMLQGTATIIENNQIKLVLAQDLRIGMILQVAAGEKIAADGKIIAGESDLDLSLITGETFPQPVKAGDAVFAGAVNLTQPLRIEITAAVENSILSDIVRLMEKAEQGQAKYVRLADRIAGYYTPAVHALAAASFLGWWLGMGIAWQPALMIATTVLIITCPCALGLAVPAVQVIASQFLFKNGVLLKSGDALERLATVDTIIFDKTGTLTEGRPQLINASQISIQDFQLAASLAGHSKHPLARALTEAYSGDILPLNADEVPGHGIEAVYNGQNARLGQGKWCGATQHADGNMEIWLSYADRPPARFVFADQIRKDAKQTIADLLGQGFDIFLLSGDRASVVEKVATDLQITNYRSALTPIDKANIIQDMKSRRKKILMVGDGLNDAPALSYANISMSPSTAIDITQNAADIVFQGHLLEPVLKTVKIAKKSASLVKQNFILSFAYNILAVPLAIIGWVTPLIAAIAMSSSSILVVVNALRLSGRRA